jgi:hypothetical protein
MEPGHEDRALEQVEVWGAGQGIHKVVWELVLLVEWGKEGAKEV